MKTLIRWGKFNFVGMMGMGLQLAALACFTRMRGHYLLATAAAIELTLLHNFTWHWFYTWRDRRPSATAGTAIVQFHAANGVVSLTGNLVLMRLLVHQAHLPVLAANAVAIACCSVANFWVSNSWVFARLQAPEMQRG